MNVSDDRTGLVLAERHGPVLLLTLNRPERLNAWNDGLEASYFNHLDAAEADAEVRAIVLTGAGRGFCAGADMDDLQTDGAFDLSFLDRERPRDLPLRLRKPLIAAINGAAVGIGLVEALYCDIRFCTPEAKLTSAFARLGLIAEYGSAWLLARTVGPSRALDLLMSGRVIRGEEAHAIGLVDELVEADDLVESAVAYASDLATKCSPASMAIIKDQIRNGQQSSYSEAFDEAERLIRESFARPDVKEGVDSYLEGRAPAFAALAAKGVET